MTAIERAVAPLDVGRTGIYRALSAGLGPAFTGLVASRERRVALVGATAVVGSLALTLGAPLTMLVWAPLVLGVPHLLADVRYLVVRPGLHRRGVLALAAGAPLAVVGAVGDAWIGLLAAVGAVLVARASGMRRGVAVAVLGLLALLAARLPGPSELVLLHLHNLVAGVAWWVWRPGRTRAQGAVALGALAGWVLLATGALDGFVSRGGPFVAGLDTSGLAAEVAPWVSLSGYHLLLAWIYAQSLHYGAWLRLVPEDDRPRRTPRPFRATARVLVAELGPWVLGGAIVAWAVVFGWGLLDPLAARAAYLRGALFHGHLEIAALALAWVERRRPGESAPAAVGAP